MIWRAFFDCSRKSRVKLYHRWKHDCWTTHLVFWCANDPEREVTCTTESPRFVTTISSLFHAHQPRERLENLETKRKSCLCSSLLLSSPVLTLTMVPSSLCSVRHKEKRSWTQGEGNVLEGIQEWLESLARAWGGEGHHNTTRDFFVKHNETAW